MRQRLFKCASGLMILMLVIGLVYVQPVDAATVKLNKKKLSLEVGSTYTLKISGTTKTVKWSSTKKSIAKVKKGTVTAVAPGKCTIKAKVGGKTYKCKVTVKNKTVADDLKVQSFSSMDKYSAALSNMIKGADKGVDWSAISSAEMHTNRVIVAGTPDLKGFKWNDAIKSPWDEYIIQFEDSETAQKFIKKQKKNKNVEYAEEDIFVPISSSTADTASGIGSWGTSYVEAGILADYINSLGISRSAVVAVIDTGVDLDHPFFKDRIAQGGRDFVDSDNDPNDEVQGHGTHVAGTIVDCTPGLDVKILPVRVLGYNGGFVSDVSCGIRYAADQGADVINLSLGGEHAETKDAAIAYAIKNGSTVVVAAGNNSTDTSRNCPAHIKSCIVVSAIDEEENRAEFGSNGGSSNYGTSVDIAAPGKNIYSSYPGGKYKALSGTSMAAPHVSAAAAMVKLMNPSFSPEDVEAYLKNNCTKDLGVTGRDDVYGYGALKLSMAVPVSIEGISVSKLPNKTSYFIGETLDTTGMELDVYYSNGRTETITSGFTSSVSTLNDEGIVNVLVSYNGFSAGFTVDVSQDVVYSLEVARLPEKVNYFLGDTLDPTKLILKARYISGAEKGIVDGFTCSPTVLETVGSQTITVTYEGCSCTYDVTVVKPELTSLKVVTMPNKLEYFDGDSVDITGLSIEATYSNGKSEIVNEGFTCSPLTASLSSKTNESGYSEKQTIKVEYEGKSITFEITVKAVYAEKLDLTTLPKKLKYFEFDFIDTKGLVLKVTYSNGKQETITEGFTAYPQFFSDPGKEDVIISYAGLEVKYEVVVEKIVLEKIKIATLPTKLKYNVGERLDTTGLSLTTSFTDGSTGTITSGFSCTPTSFSTAGVQTVTVKYEGKTDSFSVEVVNPEHTITFDANGGYTSVTSKKVLEGQAIGKLPVPTRDYYTFTGWYDASGNKYTENDIYNLKKDLTLYAYWKKNGFGSYSDWSTTKVTGNDNREVETRQVAATYHMVTICCGNSSGYRCYLPYMQSGYTKRAEPYYATFTSDQFRSCKEWTQGSWFTYATNVNGYIIGPGSAYSLPGDYTPYYVASIDYVTQYRYRDRIK